MIEVRWYYCPMTTMDIGGLQSRVSTAFIHADLFQDGVTTGTLDGPSHGITAVSFDTNTISGPSKASVEGALAEANDNEVFDIDVGLGTVANSWPRWNSFATQLNLGFIDLSRLSTSQTVKQLLREVVRTHLVYQDVGWLGVPLSTALESVSQQTRQRITNRLQTRGWPLPNVELSDPVRIFYQALLSSGPASKWRISKGGVQLGRKEAHLG